MSNNKEPIDVLRFIYDILKDYFEKPEPSSSSSSDPEPEVTLKLSSTSRTFTSDKKDWAQVTVFSKTSWTAKTSDSWIVLKTKSGSANFTAGENLYYNISENTSKDNRNGKIIVSNKDSSLTFSIIQKGTGGSSTKDRDFSQYIVNPYKPFFFKEDQPIVIDNRDPMYGKLDFGLGGDIAARVDRVWKSDGSTRDIYGKPGYDITIPNERRSYLLIVGQSNFDPDPAGPDLTDSSNCGNLKRAIPSEKNFDQFFKTTILSEKNVTIDNLLGIMVDCEAFMCNYDDPRNYKPWNSLYNSISKLEKKFGRKLPVIGSFGCGGAWHYTDKAETIKAADRLFDVAILWDYGASVEAYKTMIEKWRSLGFRGQMGIHQRMYTSGSMHPYADKWKDFVDFCKKTKYEFVLRTGPLGSTASAKKTLPLIFAPIALDGKCMSGDWNPNDPTSNVSLAKALADKYK